MDRNYLETVTSALYDGGWRSIDRLEMVREYGFGEIELNFICYLLDEMEKVKKWNVIA